MATTPRARQQGYTQALLAGAVHCAAYVAFAAGRPAIVSWWYQIVWWTYIIAADGIVYARRGESLLRSRPREAVILALFSVLLWFHFETWNLRLENWFYVRATAWTPSRAMHYCVAFATVLPGVFETYDLLRAFGVPRRVRVRPHPLTPNTWRVSYALGAACAVLPLLWPAYAFPLVWGVYVFLLEPLNARWGGASFRVDLARGNLTRLVRVLLAGAICGGLWEAWNFWARAKWIYTVPVFDELKVFEMPVLGFFGFPPFAVELWCIVTCVTLLRNVPGWRGRRHGERSTRGPVPSRRVWAAAWIAGVAYVLVQISLTDRYTVNSVWRPIADSPLARTEAGRRAAAAGFVYPDDVAAAANRGDLAARLDVSAARVDVAVGPVLVAALPSVGTRTAAELAELGIRTLDELAAADAEALAAALPAPRPPVRRVRVWVREAERAVQSGMMRGIYAR